MPEQPPINLGPIGRFVSIEWIGRTGSTNADLAELIRSDPESRRGGRVLVAEEQISGRGRRGRVWSMPAGRGVLLSVFVPWADAATAHLVPTALGVAAVDAARTLDIDLSIKWPNDLLESGPRGRKVAGMLSEIVYPDVGGDHIGVVAGIGINVSWPTPDDVASIAEVASATCLDELAPHPVDRHQLIVDLVGHLDQELTGLESSGPDSLLDRYRSRCATLGLTVRIEQADGTSRVGRATDIDGSGRLVLDDDGALTHVDVGDVVHLRTP